MLARSTMCGWHEQLAELAGLSADFIGARADADTKPVAVITGMGGMGKTAVVAEALV